MPAAKISLIISTYQSPAALEKVLQGVQRQTQHPHEILIADDGSKTPTRDLIESWQTAPRPAPRLAGGQRISQNNDSQSGLGRSDR